MKTTHSLQTLLTVLPVFTAGLYLLGMSYNQGYLSGYEINDSIFPLSNDKALFTGFIALIYLIPAGLYAIVSLAAFMILLIIAAILSSTARVRSVSTRIHGWLLHHIPKANLSPTTDALVDISSTAYGYIAGIILSVCLLLVMALSAEKSGGEQAKKEIRDFQSGKVGRATLFTSPATESYNGMLILCGDKYCAFWSNSGTTLLRHETINRIEISSPAPIAPPNTETTPDHHKPQH